jgi:hypothetical protein
MSNADSLVLSESELALMAMDRGRWVEAAEHAELAVATIDEHRMQDYATSVPTFVAAARLAVHRGDLEEANRQLTGAMRARPLCTYALPFLALCVRLELAKAYWIKGDRSSPATRDGRHFAPSARSWCSGRGVSPDRRIERAAGIGRRVASTPSRAPVDPVSADASHFWRDRGPVHLPQHRQHTGRLHLSKAGRLITQRRGATSLVRARTSAYSERQLRKWPADDGVTYTTAGIAPALTLLEATWTHRTGPW